jgi:rSAM/selenodomain-associated transferase 2
MRKPQFSIVVPALNEAEHIGACLRRIRTSCPDGEIIVVDGGSSDNTVSIAASENVIVCHSSPCRGIQCNAGARRASGEILLFLHADTLLPYHAFRLLRRYFDDPHVKVGTFRLAFDKHHWMLKFYGLFTRFDSMFTTFGDQCIVVRRSFFRECGEFPDWPLFEDVRFLQISRTRTKVHCFPAAVTTSARRFVSNGLIGQQVYSAWLFLLFLLGTPPVTLAQKYQHRANST